MPKVAVLSVAGSRKTQSIAEYCGTLDHQKRILVVTYTQANQSELKGRISRFAGSHPGITILGWYSFLVREFAKPFIPFKFPQKRVLGFNFDGRPFRMATGINRYLDGNGAAYACELGRLASELINDSRGALIHRLECIYDEILIDEVQDLSGHDWDIIDSLLRSKINIRMVGDIRQAIISTNARTSKNKKYAYSDAIHWFRERKDAGLLQIEENAITWRCHPLIAKYSDTIFDPSWSFPETVSKNETVTDHDGIFLVKPEDVHSYVQRYKPKCLRDNVRSGKEFDLDYINFGVSKGMTFKRVLIIPTGPIVQFILKGNYLLPNAAATFYVAVTRAAQSVAIVMKFKENQTIQYWNPSN